MEKKFENIVAYYNNEVENRIKKTKNIINPSIEYVLPKFDENMFFGLLLFPTNKMYFEKFDRDDLSLNITDIPNKILKGKENQMILEKELFGRNIDKYLLNNKICELDDNIINAINSYQFNLVKLLLTGEVYDKKFAGKNYIDIVNNYRINLDSKYKNQFQLLLEHYYYDNHNTKCNMYERDEKEMYDIIIDPISSIVSGAKADIFVKMLKH